MHSCIEIRSDLGQEHHLRDVPIGHKNSRQQAGLQLLWILAHRIPNQRSCWLSSVRVEALSTWRVEKHYQGRLFYHWPLKAFLLLVKMCLLLCRQILSHCQCWPSRSRLSSPQFKGSLSYGKLCATLATQPCFPPPLLVCLAHIHMHAISSQGQPQFILNLLV